MPTNDLTVTVDAKQNSAGAREEPQNTTVPATDVSAEATTGLDLRGYELSERLGGGGMGDVYRAGDPALGRDLAVKVMKAELQGFAAAEQRFQREARVSGSLQHPGIVPIYNLGRLADGRLHYTMRLVRGRTFADILKEEAGKPEHWSHLLAILEKVCQAVAYAHSKRVLHRDLKPSNIMVGRFGEVQVMDWGLAKLLTEEDRPGPAEDGPETEGTRIHTESGETPLELTRLGREMGTPAYMPPEQALGDWNAVDERADVFALGAILCQILTGLPPYSGGDVLQKAKRGDRTEALARLQGCGADAALLGLCRDCLSAAREGRPRDAEQVAQRLAVYQTEVQERLRRAELARSAAMVQAREERKRRRWMWAAVFLLLAGAAISIGLMVRAKRAESIAQTRLEQIEKANDVSMSIFHDLDPHAEEKGGLSLRQQLSQHLQRAATQLDEGAVADAATAGRLQTMLGKSLLSLGQTKQAIELLSKAATTLEAQLGRDHSDTLSCRDNLACAYRVAGRTAESIHLHELILKQREAKFGAEHADTLTSCNNLASAYCDAGQFADAIPLFEKTLKQSEAALGPEHPHTLSSRNNLAAAYCQVGRTAHALPLLEQILKQREAKFGVAHPSTLNSRSNLASAYWSAGRTAEAIRLHKLTLKQREAKLGADHPDTLTSRHALASVYWSAGRIVEAIPLFEQNLKQREAKLGADHPDTLRSRNNLATAYSSASRTAEAIQTFESTLKQCETKLGTDHPLTLACRNGLAMAYKSAGRTAEAIRLHKQNLKLSETKFAADHPDTLQWMANLGVTYRDVGQFAEAISMLETALQRGRQRSDGLPALLAWVPGALAETYGQAGQFAKAEPIYRGSLEQAQRQFGPDDRRTGDAVALLGNNLLKQKKFNDAEPLLRQCLTIRAKTQADAWTTFNTRSLLGEALCGQKKYTAAEPLLVQGYEGIKQREDKIPPPVRRLCLNKALQRLVQLYEAMQQKDKAADYRKKLQHAKAAPKKTDS